jgi:DNA repair exonuclease SbcCD ATPase subunit
VLTFQKLRFKNFQSFGNEVTEIDLDSKTLTLITGKNGAGKSTIVDALNFALFGRPYRKVKIGDLVNRINGKQLYTEIEISKNDQKWKIGRGLSPQKLDIYKGDELQSKQDIRDMQDFIEKNILGFDEKIFRQIVTLGSGYYVPFLKLPLAQKREIIEQLFELDIFSKMKIVVKDALSKHIGKLTNISSEKVRVENTILNLKEEIDRSEKHNLSVKKEVEENKIKIKKQIDVQQETIDKAKEGIKIAEEKIKGIGGTEVKIKLESVKKEISETTIKIGTVENDVKKKWSLQQEEKQKEKDKIQVEIDDFQDYKSKLDLNYRDTDSRNNQTFSAEERKLEKVEVVLNRQKEETLHSLEFYRFNTVCPTCKSELTGEKIEKLVKELEGILSNTDSEISILKDKHKDLSLKCTEVAKTMDSEYKDSVLIVTNKISNLRNKKDEILKEFGGFTSKIENEITVQSGKWIETLGNLKTEKSQIEIVLESIMKLEEEIKKFENDILVMTTAKKIWEDKLKTVDSEAKYINLEPIQEKLKENRDLIVKLNKDEKQIELIINYFKVAESLVSDSGIKSQIIKHYLPILVSKVNEYLALFSAEYSIEFTEEFDIHIQLRKNEYVDYDNFSGGEKIRIDLALIFSFVSFIKMKTGAMCSLLFFDEILDSSLDMNGITSLVQILNLFTQTGFTVMVVSHREENRSEDFKKIFEIKKEKFSKIEEI